MPIKLINEKAQHTVEVEGLQAEWDVLHLGLREFG